ncbi:hypothetical protein D5R81_12245 [Parashewanella spongiae]|uniref:Uncharacterized protein n=1 Tax=Parashewanella spongiae TaxID=342950 RepID=A0A3A6TBY5_9GAMM|nr:hypothetical protein D5R81_12245 [Parashewanella spongiae]
MSVYHNLSLCAFLFQALSGIFRASSNFKKFDTHHLILEILKLMKSVDYEMKPKHAFVQKRVNQLI